MCDVVIDGHELPPRLIAGSFVFAAHLAMLVITA